jgi:hypothetical protein
MPLVDESVVGDFTRDGAVVLRGVLGPTWLDLLATGVEYNRTHPSEWSHWYTSPDEAVGFWSDYVTWPRSSRTAASCSRAASPPIAGRLMGSRRCGSSTSTCW